MQENNKRICKEINPVMEKDEFLRFFSANNLRI